MNTRRIDRNTLHRRSPAYRSSSALSRRSASIARSSTARSARSLSRRLRLVFSSPSRSSVRNGTPSRSIVTTCAASVSSDSPQAANSRSTTKASATRIVSPSVNHCGSRSRATPSGSVASALRTRSPCSRVSERSRRSGRSRHPRPRAPWQAASGPRASPDAQSVLHRAHRHSSRSLAPALALALGHHPSQRRIGVGLRICQGLESIEALRDARR